MSQKKFSFVWFFLWELGGGLMERQDTNMQARGPSYVNIVNATASQSRYHLRFTNNVNDAIYFSCNFGKC